MQSAVKSLEEHLYCYLASLHSFAFLPTFLCAIAFFSKTLGKENSIWMRSGVSEWLCMSSTWIGTEEKDVSSCFGNEQIRSNYFFLSEKKGIAYSTSNKIIFFNGLENNNHSLCKLRRYHFFPSQWVWAICGVWMHLCT